MATSPKASNYSAKNIQLVEGLEHVRKRPGMYIGSTGIRGLMHLIEEIVANSVDEAMAGYCNKIIVEIEKEEATGDVWATVIDNGRGIPVDIHEETGISALELVLTRLGGGGKWNAEDGGYKVSGGLHGVGSSVVNAVSEEMFAVVKRDGYEWNQSYKQGVPDAQVARGDKSDENGTSISWLFDREIFEKGVTYERETLERRLRELSYLNPGLEFVLRFYGHKEEKFLAKGGLSDYMKYLVSEREAVEAIHKAPLRVSGDTTDEGYAIHIDAAFYWTTSQQEMPFSFANSINTFEGGTHMQGTRSALRKALNDAGQELSKIKAKDEPFSQEDVREGVFYAIAVQVSEPQFEGQTKMKLGNPEVQRRVDAFLSEHIKAFLLEKKNRPEADKIIQRCIESRDGRLAAKKAKDSMHKSNGLLGAGGLPGKLADCASKNPEETEIFIVEGDSAGGGMKQARSKANQAILPLRGKIQNAEKAGEKALEAEQIKDLLAALGGTVTPVKTQVVKNGRTVNKTKLVVDLTEPRYHKIIMTTDADVDGGHIAALLMTFFFRHAEDLIRQGRLYVAQLPLYKIEHKKLGRLYLFTDEELQDYTAKNEIKTRPDGTQEVQRFKGLGEMMSEQLRELALDPETRKIRRIMIDDLAASDDAVSLCMGSRVDRRREFIQEHALDVEAVND